MCTSTFSKLTEDVSEKDLDEQGLIDNHSYTLMGVFKVTLDDMSEETDGCRRHGRATAANSAPCRATGRRSSRERRGATRRPPHS